MPEAWRVHSSSVRLTLISKSLAPWMAEVLPGIASLARSLRRWVSALLACSAADMCRFLLLEEPSMFMFMLNGWDGWMHVVQRMVMVVISRVSLLILLCIVMECFVGWNGI